MRVWSSNPSSGVEAAWLMHHAHILITDGADSYRLAQATAGKGVKPLA